jgi:hypothetical protein
VVLGDVERGARRDVVAPISGTHVVARPSRVTASWGGKGVSNVEVNSFRKVPANVYRLNNGIGQT